MADFGAEESFGQAAKRFQEHYGWTIDRSAVRREVKKMAQQAQEYLETRLSTTGLDYWKPLEVRPDVEQMLVELDGSHIRTGKKVDALGKSTANRLFIFPHQVNGQQNPVQ